MCRRVLFAAFAALALAACTNNKPKLNELTVDQVAQGLKAGTLHAFDANTDGFRKKNGTVPGAKLLDDHDGYDCAKTLPEDKAAALVFYCSGKL
jgi:hypothetical protein